MPTKTIQSQGLAEIQKILHLMNEKQFEAGQYIFNEGKEDNYFYIVMKGNVEISKKTSDGKSKVIAHLKSGEILGEGVLSGITNKPASARAITQVRLLCLYKNDFDELIKSNAKAGIDFLMSVVQTLNHRLNRTDTMLLSLYEINKLLGIHRDDMSSLAHALVEKLMVITESSEGIILLKNPFSEDYRVIFSTTEKLSEKTFNTLKKEKSRIIVKDNYQYLFINLKDIGLLILQREAQDKHYEDEHLRLMVLVAEQAANTIESASRRAADKARNMLHQKRFTL